MNEPAAAAAAAAQKEAASLLKEAGFIRRARGWHLYTEDGRRLVDLWLSGGKALLGHTPGGLLHELKNTAGRGLFAPYPSRAECRFFKALRALFPSAGGFVVEGGELPAAAAHGPGSGCPDSGPGSGRAEYPLWRPFSAEGESASQAAAFVPVLPWPLAPRVIVQNGGGTAAGGGRVSIESGRVSIDGGRASIDGGRASIQSGLCSAVILAATTRAIYTLLAEGRRGAVQYRKIDAALKKAEEAGTSVWRRDGIYLYYKSGENAAACRPPLFRAFLAAGFLLPPDPRDPLILPGELQAGEEAKLAALLEESCKR